MQRAWGRAGRAAMLGVAMLGVSACATSGDGLRTSAVGAGTPARLAPGAGSFVFTGWAGKPINVFYYIPERVDAKTRVLIVMHGMGRNAEGYRNDWVPHARQGNYIVLTPEYTTRDYPNSRTYNLGHIAEENGQARPRAQWSFSAIEPMFDYIRRATGTKVARYGIYGHSAGGQFLHRFLTLVPNARFSHMVVANSGWYTMPDLAVDYPYGLRGAPVSRAQLASALGKPVTVLLGTADIDPNHHQLLRTPQAMAQGPHRMARGEHFFAQAKAAAAALKTRFAWKIAYAPGIAHSNKGMSAAAAQLIWK